MASRLIIVNDSTFVPDDAITRADFTEYMVKALGLYQEEPLLKTEFTDIDHTNEHALAIQIAKARGQRFREITKLFGSFIRSG